MAPGFEQIIVLIGDMSIAEHTKPVQKVRKDLEELIRVAEETIEHARQAESGIDSNYSSNKDGAPRRHHSQCQHYPERPYHGVRCIAGRPRSRCAQFVSHFKRQIRNIVEEVVNATTDNSTALRRILEHCYNQSVRQSGVLHSDNYFYQLEETQLESPYDHDFESEDYYEHENWLEIDEGYANAERERQQRAYEQRHKRKKAVNWSWIKFWANELSKIPVGPTLFIAPAMYSVSDGLANVPRYLFRTFDLNSSGKSNDTVVASAASMYKQTVLSRTDLLSLERKDAATRLVSHLDKPCFGTGSCSDNLMSWTSSLLFAVQYAIWRSYKCNTSLSDIMICALDTSRFSHGQFARDTWLMQNQSNENTRLAELDRIREMGYDNGEYLSQGTLYHKGHSCVVSLQSLTNAGLLELHEEFGEDEGRDRWLSVHTSFATNGAISKQRRHKRYGVR